MKILRLFRSLVTPVTLVTSFVLVFLAVSMESRAQHMTIERPAGKPVPFAKIQEKCVSIPGLEFGKGKAWRDCKLTRARFVVTIGLLDFYHAQYCMMRSPGKCDRQALVIFANRAYKEDAVPVLQRIDPPGTKYDDPLVTGSGSDNLLAVSATLPSGNTMQRAYYLWRDTKWNLLDDRQWKSAVQEKLPRGSRISEAGTPDPATLTVTLSVSQPDRNDVQRLNAELGFAKGEFFVRNLVPMEEENHARQHAH